MPTNIINIPPAADATIYPSGGTFAFVVGSNCTVCFGTATPPGSFPTLENQTFQWTAGSSFRYPVPSTVGADLPYNTSAPGTPCLAMGPQDIGRIIHVGSGMGAPTQKGKSKPAGKAKGKPKTKAKPKAAPKTKTKAKSKSKSKAKSKPKVKAKPKKRAKSRR
jgi:hypothetical protein